LPEIPVRFYHRPVRLTRDVRLDQRHRGDAALGQLASDLPARLKQLFKPHEVVEHLHDAPARQNVVQTAQKSSHSLPRIIDNFSLAPATPS